MSGGHSFSPPPPPPPRPPQPRPQIFPDRAEFTVGQDRYGRALTAIRERKGGQVLWQLKRDPHDQRDTSPWIEGVPDDVMQRLALIIRGADRDERAGPAAPAPGYWGPRDLLALQVGKSYEDRAGRRHSINGYNATTFKFSAIDSSETWFADGSRWSGQLSAFDLVREVP